MTRIVEVGGHTRAYRVARRPSIFRGARAMWTGLGASGLIDGRLAALVNRRVAALNGCEF